MSKFSEKVFRGEQPSDDEWTEHLIEAHRLAPSMTPNAFASYRTAEGISSYETLAKILDKCGSSNSRVLDLACGDGYLLQFILPKVGARGSVFGVDMSEAELAVARKNYSDRRISFFCAKAQSLPFKDQSIDVVLCHMAFMLMLPVEPVVSELARILTKDGLFSAVIGNPKGTKGFFAELQKVAFQFMDARYPRLRSTKSGDMRVYTEEGLKDLFKSDLGFGDFVEHFEFSLQVKTNLSGVWNMMKDTYFISMLPANEKIELQREMENFCQSKANAEGLVSFEFPMKKFSVAKKR